MAGLVGLLEEGSIGVSVSLGGGNEGDVSGIAARVGELLANFEVLLRVFVKVFA